MSTPNAYDPSSWADATDEQLDAAHTPKGTWLSEATAADGMVLVGEVDWIAPPEPPTTDEQREVLDRADELRALLRRREGLSTALDGASHKLGKLQRFTDAARAEVARLEAEYTEVIDAIDEITGYVPAQEVGDDGMVG